MITFFLFGIILFLTMLIEQFFALINALKIKDLQFLKDCLELFENLETLSFIIFFCSSIFSFFICSIFSFSAQYSFNFLFK